MAAGRFNTMSEGLQKVAADLTVMMTTPDADLDFLTELQTQILQKLREPFRDQNAPPPPDAGQGQMPPEIAAMMGGQAGPVGIPMGGGPPPGVGGSMPPMGPGNPNEDELRRLMGG